MQEGEENKISKEDIESLVQVFSLLLQWNNELPKLKTAEEVVNENDRIVQNF